MTATTATATAARRGATTIAQVRRLARGAASVLAAIGDRWNAFVDSGQLGPSAESATCRHTGSRI